MKKERKTTNLHARITPTAKKELERLAAADDRSEAQYLERLIMKASAESKAK